MKTLSIRQPHAHAIIHGIEQTDGSRLYKPVENRDWRCNIRGRIAIHASQFNPKELREAREFWEDRGILGIWPKALVYGAVIGTVEICDCVMKFDSPFFVGSYGFLLRDPIPMEPVTASGSLGFWNWEPPNAITLP